MTPEKKIKDAVRAYLKEIGAYYFMPPGPDRWKERSRTLTGIAAAMADQWGEGL